MRCLVASNDAEFRHILAEVCRSVSLESHGGDIAVDGVLEVLLHHPDCILIIDQRKGLTPETAWLQGHAVSSGMIAVAITHQPYEQASLFSSLTATVIDSGSLRDILSRLQAASGDSSRLSECVIQIKTSHHLPDAKLIKAYGRNVPRHVRLSDGFDAPAEVSNKAGDVVRVVLPPPNIEVDNASIFVHLDQIGSGPVESRIYEHEYTTV